MGEKSYLKEQIRLPSFTSYDLFTDEEFELYLQIAEAKNELNRLEEEDGDEELRQQWLERKRKARDDLTAKIGEHNGVPRRVRLQSVVYHARDADEPFPEGLTWKNLKKPRKISEFASELSRAMGLKHLDYTLDLLVIRWKSQDVLRQIVEDGFIIPILNPDGTVTDKPYHFLTASAGQLRRDKIQCISDEMWEKIRGRIECGLTWDVINKKKGINANKYLAYIALCGSATDVWTDFDIDRCIVIPEFEGEVTGRMRYIKSDYTFEDTVHTVKIDHTDGCGMMLPSVSPVNFQFRGPFFKGLLAVFDFIAFCRMKGIPAVIKDLWGVEHDLIAENIQILFTESTFKMWKYYDSWDHYKQCFKASGANFGKTNYEEERVDSTYLNYQMILFWILCGVIRIANVVNLQLQGVA